MRSFVADDAMEIAKAHKKIQIERLDPSLLMKCALMIKKTQNDCTVCNNPEIPCIGCIRRRTGNSSASLSECPLCWQQPNLTCPSR